MTGATMGVISLVTSIVSSVAQTAVAGYGAYQQHQASKVQEDNFKTQMKMAEEQAKEAEESANDYADASEAKAIEVARRQRMANKKRLEFQRASMAESGLDINTGTAFMIQEADDITSSLNAIDTFKTGLNRGEEIRYAGQQKKRGLLWEAEQYHAMASQEKRNRYSNDIANVIGIVATGSKMASDYYNKKQNTTQVTSLGSWGGNNQWGGTTMATGGQQGSWA